jgi:hypothetical protein
VRARELDPELLSYHLIRPRHAGIADVALLGETYRCWSEVWSETLLELDGTHRVPSDEFTRQDEIGAIFHGYECVALTCFRWVDLSLSMTLEDSYFDIWSQEARHAASRNGSLVCIGSHLSVSSAWRKVAGYSLRQVILAMTIDRFMAAADGAAILGTMRDDRGMGRLVEALGATRLGTGQLHGVPVSLIAVYRSALRTPLDEKNESLVTRLRHGLVGGHQ